MPVTRRKILALGGVAAVTAVPLAYVFLRDRSAGWTGRFGPLRSDPGGILDLPEGFTYQVLEEKFAPMSDGYRVPAQPDGMACFDGPDNTWVVMRNHELDSIMRGGPYRDGQAVPPQAYDKSAIGGVTRLVVDRATGKRVSSNLVLAGTTRNCAGGTSPWGWLSCEETVDAGHGYVFVCPADAATVSAPRRVVGYGRCRHEAAVVDPATNICYLTEDRGDGCFYRFVPLDKSKPFEGQLQALAIRGQAQHDTSKGIADGGVHVEWVPIADPDPKKDTLRREAHKKGAAIFRRGEGIHLHRDEQAGQTNVYISATSGGRRGAGQIFRLQLGEPDRLHLVVESPGRSILDHPDNITVTPWGELYMAEDGGGQNLIRGITRDGRVFDFARNAKSRSEIAGVCFSSDGSTMFLNLQWDGITIGVSGPFKATS